jgi:hypothetical protein
MPWRVTPNIEVVWERIIAHAGEPFEPAGR